MSTTFRVVAGAVALALGVPGAALADGRAAVSPDLEGGAVAATIAPAEEGRGSDNLSFVTNLQFPEVVEGGSFKATDLDFHSYPVHGGDDGAARRGLPPQAADRLPAPARARAGQGFGGGDDVTVATRDFAFVGTALNGLHVVDITDRESPQLVARYDCRISQSDVFVFEQGDRVLAAYTLDAVSQNQPVEDSTCHADNGLVGDDTRGTFLIDITDPYDPRSVSFLPMRKGTHQVTVHPSGDYVYNSAAVLVTTELGTIEVWDVGAEATPEDPVLVDELQLLTGLDSHDMTFNEDGTRLYSAALTHSLIIDTTDPTDNAVVGRIVDPAINIHHDAHAVTVDTPIGERDYLFIGDELAGAVGTGVCPGGGIHVFDITGGLERLPVKVGAFFIPEVRVSPGLEVCTAHVLDVQPDQQLISIAWYNAGVRILDYSGLGDLGPAGLSVGLDPQMGSLTPGIQEVGHFQFPDSDLWSAKVPEVEPDGSFYIYGGDIARTLDVFRYDATVEAQPDGGSWVDPRQALSIARTAGGQLREDDGNPFTCLIARRL